MSNDCSFNSIRKAQTGTERPKSGLERVKAKQAQNNHLNAKKPP